MSKNFGFDLLAEQVADYLAGEWGWSQHEKGAMVGDTPIEKLLFAALKIKCEIGGSEFLEVLLVDREERLGKGGGPHGMTLYVWPQAKIGGHRADFLIFALHFVSKESPPPWRKLVVECDGHDFHERTKEQAAKDRALDRSMMLIGQEFLRFTGSEIWRDPMGCADQILDWASGSLYP